MEEGHRHCQMLNLRNGRTVRPPHEKQLASFPLSYAPEKRERVEARRENMFSRRPDGHGSLGTIDYVVS